MRIFRALGILDDVIAHSGEPGMTDWVFKFMGMEGDVAFRVSIIVTA